ncbi:Homeobox-leucine zipper protein ATHB-17 [Cardamine amara subsp. amara]|uniref:Homeobox-leucine zipper protein ATHB-17 n=1 Tax=Cardamine amara subsp. amara TaxID=228776 RepID=A0ABD1ANF5_CARAN
MAILPENSSNLDLTISVPGFSSSPPSDEGSGGGREQLKLDMNRLPSCEDGDDEELSHHDGSAPPRKKLRLTREQSRLLEDSFRQNHTLNPKQKEALAKHLMLRPRQIEVWFQNRRARSKLKQTEMECEYLKRWFGSLTEQNHRLHREVEELRAMKVGPPTMTSASSMTMCPRCERVTTAASPSKGVLAVPAKKTFLPQEREH